MFEPDPLLLARTQFAFTISFHIIFPSLSIGLAAYLAVLEGLYLRTRREVFMQLYRFWVKIFAIVFGLGVVSGVVMSYQFGTNWSLFSDATGNVLGPLLGYEVLTAFFLEASFLGIMLFGAGRVSERMHFVATAIVAIGTLISAFWILSANSWMQTPQGYRIGEDGLFYATSWIEIIFNPSFPYRFAHMATAAYLTTAFLVGGVGAWYLLQNKAIPQARTMLGMAVLMAITVAPVQLILGDLHGLNTLEHQPIKVAAMEGIWETERGAGLRLLGWPDNEAETTHFSVEIPKLASLILTHHADGEIQGLLSVPPEDRPPVAVVFWAFRIMVGLGMLMILTGLVGAILWKQRKLFEARWFQRWCVAMSPAGVLAVLAGWFVTEVGRQPFTVYGVMRTADSVAPILSDQLGYSLMGFISVYAFVFGSGLVFIFKVIHAGPEKYLIADVSQPKDINLSSRLITEE